MVKRLPVFYNIMCGWGSVSLSSKCFDLFSPGNWKDAALFCPHLYRDCSAVDVSFHRFHLLLLPPLQQ